jgi:hypothetical protein
MNFAHFMGFAGVEKDALTDRCFARVNVGHDANVANFCQRKFLVSHNITSPVAFAPNLFRDKKARIMTGERGGNQGKYCLARFLSLK